MAGVVLC